MIVLKRSGNSHFHFVEKLQECQVLKKLAIFKIESYQESMAGFEIQATGMVEFEDGLRTVVLPRGFWGP